MIGRTFSHYRILERIGVGGMGQVFLAEDERLQRKVAFKVLPEIFAADPDRLARFQREARTLAALNHPHIAQIYGVEDSPQVRALVMELVPGESLAARLERGPVPLLEALEYARQAADGLSAAHDKGIVHRDLKPANVQVTPEGVVKVLDFGLAKPAGPEGDVTDAATLTSPAQMTAAGIVLGTAAYMSPEQARGGPVDSRTDVWALGATLYEMLTGERPFPGPTVTDTLAQILEREPVWSKLPAGTPAAVRTLLQRCLKKDARHRLHDIADARFALEDALAATSGDSVRGVADFPSEKPALLPQKTLPIVLAGLSLVLAAALIWSVASDRSTEEREPLRLSLALPPSQELVAGGIAISPDGRDLVYPAVSEEGAAELKGRVVRLFHRRLSESASRALPGTEGGRIPMFSPDGQWIAYYSSTDIKLKRIALSGGGPVLIANLPPLEHQARGEWTSDGYILIGHSNGPVRRVAAAGATVEVIVPREVLKKGEQGFIFPVAIPGEKGALFGLSPGPGIAAYKDGQRRDLFKEGLQPRFFDARHLLFWQRTGKSQMDLSIVPFDVDRVEPTGTSIPIISVDSESGIVYDVSRNGTLVYRAGASEFRLGRFAWLPIDGTSTLRSMPRSAEDIGTIYSPRISPDGRYLLYHESKAGTPPRFVLISLDLVSGMKRNLLSGRNFWAIWSHDGKRIIYQEPVDAPGGGGLQWKPADGSGPPERLTSSQSWQQPQFVTNDGRFLVYQETGGLATRSSSLEENYDLWLLPLTPRGDPLPLLRTQANERLAHLSPDQRWMAYVLDETDQSQIWVRSFPEGASAIQVTQDGGTEPIWAPDGKMLYYRDSTGMRLFSVPVVAGTIPQFGTPVVTSGHWVAAFTYGRQYDIAPDGKAMLMLPQGTYGRTLSIVLQFDTLVRRRLAEAKK